MDGWRGTGLLVVNKPRSITCPNLSLIRHRISFWNMSSYHLSVDFGTWLEMIFTRTTGRVHIFYGKYRSL